MAFLFYFGLYSFTVTFGTGSYPCVHQGWHFDNRFNPSQPPLNEPCILTASIKYSEQVGVCLQDAGVNGEMHQL